MEENLLLAALGYPPSTEENPLGVVLGDGGDGSPQNWPPAIGPAYPGGTGPEDYPPLPAPGDPYGPSGGGDQWDYTPDADYTGYPGGGPTRIPIADPNSL